MHRIASTEAERNLDALLETVRSGPVTIEKAGEAAAVLLSIDDYRALDAAAREGAANPIGQGLAHIKTAPAEKGAEVFRRVRQGGA